MFSYFNKDICLCEDFILTLHGIISQAITTDKIADEIMQSLPEDTSFNRELYSDTAIDPELIESFFDNSSKLQETLIEVSPEFLSYIWFLVRLGEGEDYKPQERYDNIMLDGNQCRAYMECMELNLVPKSIAQRWVFTIQIATTPNLGSILLSGIHLAIDIGLVNGMLENSLHQWGVI